MANTASSAASASKKELSAIVSNLLAEQQKINERIAALEQIETASATPNQEPQDVRITIADADIEKFVVRMLKEDGLYLSDATADVISRNVIDAMTKKCELKMDVCGRAIHELLITTERHSKVLEKLMARVGKIEDMQEKETQKAHPSAAVERKNWEDRIAKIIGHSIAFLLKPVFVFLMSILRVLWQTIAYLWHIAVGYFSDDYNSPYDYYGEQKANRILYWLVFIPALTAVFIYMIISCNSMP